MGKKNFLPFEEAREFAISLRLKNQREWYEYIKAGEKPDNIPYSPSEKYKNFGWISWGDWLGCGIYKPQPRGIYLPFEEAREFAKTLGLCSRSEWEQWKQTDAHPKNIPCQPQSVYKKSGWQGWGDWLGTGTVRHDHNDFLPFEEAKEFVRNLSLCNVNSWRQWVKTDVHPKNIPSCPNMVYKNFGWTNWEDWLGCGINKYGRTIFLPFEEARKFARTLGLCNVREWEEWIKKDVYPDNIPACPYHVYKNSGWQGYPDWLGYDVNNRFLSFGEAREFAISLNLKGQSEWLVYTKSKEKPNNIPSHPDRVYKNSGWVNWGNWLGTGNIWYGYNNYLSFEEARKFVRTLGLRNIKEWKQWVKTDACLGNLPSCPHYVYKNSGWQGYPDWLGYRKRISYGECVIARFLSHNKIEFEQQYTIDLCKNIKKLPFDFGIIKDNSLLGLIEFNGQQHYENVWGETSLENITRSDNIKYQFCISNNIPFLIIDYRDFDNIYDILSKFILDIIDEFNIETPAELKINDAFGDVVSYEEAQKICMDLNIKTIEEYSKINYKKYNLPYNPSSFYKNRPTWSGWGAFLQTGNVAPQFKKFISYEEAQKICNTLDIVYRHQYKKLILDLYNLPVVPERTYKKQWINWAEFLNTDCVFRKEFVSYEEAQQLCKENNIRTANEYYSKYKEIMGTPSNPRKIYTKQWISWKDFLGTNFIFNYKKYFVSYEEAQQLCKENNINTAKEYKIKYKAIGGLPCEPNTVYKDCWVNWTEFLEIYIKNTIKNFVSYKEAQQLCKENNIQTANEYCNKYKTIGNIPIAPHVVYKQEWTSWAEFLGTNNIYNCYKKDFVSYEEAQLLCRENNIRTEREYQVKYKTIKSLPCQPRKIYKHNWVNWMEFLGKTKILSSI